MKLASTENGQKLPDTGLKAVGEVPWGTHFCIFYETKQDLLDALLPYFKAGLDNKEFCLWVVSADLTVEEAKLALEQFVPHLDRHLLEGNIEFYGHAEWYLQKGQCEPQRVLQGWREKLSQAFTAGCSGLRASGDGGWISNDDWMVFCDYEKEVDALIKDKRSIILCSYPLATSSGAQVFDAARIHRIAVARRRGGWELMEAPELKQAKAEIERLNSELEQKVDERTRQLATTNEALRSEIVERKLAVEAVKQAEDRTRLIIDTIPTMAWSLGPDGVLDFLNQRWLDYTGLSLEEAIEEPTRTVHPEDLSRALEKWLVVKATSEVYEDEIRLQRADGEYRWFLVRVAPLLDEQGSIVKWFGASVDIEGRKRAEKDLEEANRQLKLLSRRRVKVQEEERRHLARELHDEIGQALTAAKINLQAAMEEPHRAKSNRIHETTAILERLLSQVRQISLNLRPSILDDLGLVPALRSLLDEQGRLASVAVRFSAKNIPEDLDPEIQTTCFRIAQEAITNVVRHANARQMDVDLRREDGTFRLQVRDDGKGFDAESAQAQTIGLGLLGMKERAALVGGRTRITSSPGKGTTVDVTLPLTSQSEHQNHHLGR
jgi:PAS domain S-box-containing protein